MIYHFKKIVFGQMDNTNLLYFFNNQKLDWILSPKPSINSILNYWQMEIFGTAFNLDINKIFQMPIKNG
jgi:hypothetical protein